MGPAKFQGRDVGELVMELEMMMMVVESRGGGDGGDGGVGG